MAPQRGKQAMPGDETSTALSAKDELAMEAETCQGRSCRDFEEGSGSARHDY